MLVQESKCYKNLIRSSNLAGKEHASAGTEDLRACEVVREAVAASLQKCGVWDLSVVRLSVEGTRGLRGGLLIVASAPFAYGG